METSNIAALTQDIAELNQLFTQSQNALAAGQLVDLQGVDARVQQLCHHIAAATH